jgi:hypothetical protein
MIDHINGGMTKIILPLENPMVVTKEGAVFVVNIVR